jgi:serine/threonine-protein kinase RsbW
MESQKHTNTFSASLDVLEEVRELITEIGMENGYGKKEIYKLTLAVDEIITNIIKHGYLEKSIKNGTFGLIIQPEERQLIVCLEDNAVQYNPLDHVLPSEKDLNTPLEERPIGGLGVMIARQSVDEFRYEYTDNKNKNIFIVNKAKK